MRPARRLSAWIPVLSGLGLLLASGQTSLLAFALAAPAGALLIAGGARGATAPDLRAPQHIAVGCLFGFVVVLPLGLLGGAALAGVGLVASLASFFAAGWLAISLEPDCEGVEQPKPSLGYAATVALDDALLAVMTIAQRQPDQAELRDSAAESVEAYALYADRGWLEKPESFHSAPPPLETVDSTRARAGGVDYEGIRFESGYEPDPELPGRERWLGYEANRTAHAFVVRAEDGPRPWLVCIHGFGMGKPALDLPAFRVKEMHRRLGINVALYALPVHGPRAPGRRSGGEFMQPSPMNFVHAEGQAIWDLRRLVGWIRAQDALGVGVFGISLGGFTAALLAGLEDDLACAIIGIPPTDFIGQTRRFASSLDLEVAASAGVDWDRDTALHSVVSALSFAPRIEREGRFIFAATGDRLVPIRQVQALWRHWDRPETVWVTGGHVTSQMQKPARALVDSALERRLVGTREGEG